jgi:small-conductance mechanosensitive channel
MKKDSYIRHFTLVFLVFFFSILSAVVENIISDSVEIESKIIKLDTLQVISSDSVNEETLKGNKKAPIKITDVLSSEKISETKNRLKVSKLFLSILAFTIGWLFIKYITIFLNFLSERWPKYRLSIKSFIPVIRTVSWTFVISFIIIAIIKPPIQSIITITASAGIAIGFASQDILKNIFGGIVILLDKPFRVGDKIQMESHYGEVIGIGLRTVRVVTPDDSVISIPNSEIVSKSVSNANSGEPDCQVVAEFYFQPDINLEKAHSLAIKCASLSRYVYLNKPIAVVFKNEMFINNNMIKMRLKAYVFDHRYEFAFITEMTKIVLKEFENAGLIKK